MPERRPLYQLPTLADAETIYVCEGEKAADAARSLGLVATCSSGGSHAASKTDWSLLAGKRVVILPDNDSPGEKFANDVARLAMAAGARSVMIVRLPGLPDKGDIADWSGSLGDLLGLVKLAKPWNPKRPPAPGVERFRPFPVDALPNPIRRFVYEAAAIGCDPSYVALPMLSVLGAAIGSTRLLQIKLGWLAPPILWTAIVGESGTQKTPPWDLATAPLSRRQALDLDLHAEEEREYEAELACYEKSLKVWKNGQLPRPEKPTPPEARPCLVSDTTVEALAPILKANPRGILMARDELSGWLGSFNRYTGGNANADEAHWLSAYNGKGITVDRKSGTPKTIHVPQAFISIAGGIQPEILRRSLGRAHFESGLAARFLYSCPPRKSKRWTDSEVQSRTVAEYAETVERLLSLTGGTDSEGNPCPVLLQFVPEAKDVWIAFFERHADEQAAMEGDRAAAWSKLEEIPARLAIILHEVKREGGPYITPESIQEAVILTEWFKHESARLLAMFAESDEKRDRRVLLEIIDRMGGRITPRELARSSRRYQPTEVAESALQDLVQEGIGRWQLVETMGRQRRDFVLVDGVDVDGSL